MSRDFRKGCIVTEVTPMEAIRMLSGMFKDDKDEMSTRLFMCCLIARNAVGDAEDAFTDEQLAKCGIKLKRQEGIYVVKQYNRDGFLSSTLTHHKTWEGACAHAKMCAETSGHPYKEEAEGRWVFEDQSFCVMAMALHD